MSLPTRMYFPVVTAALLTFTLVAQGLAEELPERRCSMDRTVVQSVPRQDLAKPPDYAACQVSVFFETGSAILAPDARRLLDQAAPEILAHLAAGGRVRVVGYASSARADEAEELSRRRARAVAAYLEAAWGIPQRRLALRGWGSLVADERVRPGMAENRRATLVLDAGSPEAARARPSTRSAPQPGHLDLDDFGGARNPLAGPVIRIWAAPPPRHD